MLRLAIVLIALTAPFASAQESRGSIRGKVSDPSGAPVVAAQVEVVNVSTNVVLRAASNSEGNYDVPYLITGTYRISVSLAGFKNYTRDGVEVRVNDRITLDVTLELGAVGESITVQGDAPLVDAASASLGSVVNAKRITELPVAGGNAYHFGRFVAGITATGGHAPGNPTQDLIGAYTVNGTRAGNSEALVDGLPNMANGASTYMAPPQDMVEEFRVQTATYDAGAGRAAGAVVSLTTKSGTNTLHGTAYWLYSPIRAVPWFQSRWLYDPKTGPITDEKRFTANPPWLYMRWGATLSGPLVIPKLYNGRNRTFWSAGYEGMEVKRQQSTTGTFPTLDQRNGDLSKLLALGASYQVYDPMTATLNSAGRVVRTPFAGNIIPANRISPIAQNILSYYPAPNTAGDATGTNNYVRAENQIWKYRSFATRVDHNFSDRWRIFGRYGLSEFGQSTQTYPSIAFGAYSNPKGDRFGFDSVHTLSPSMILEFRYGYVHMKPYNAPLSRGFDITTLGFPASLVNQIGQQADLAGMAFPAVSIDTFTSMSQGGGSVGSNYSQTFGSTLSRTHGNHSSRIGGEYRLYRDNSFAYGNIAPALSFNSTYTKATDTAAAAPIGLGLASLLVGVPSGGQVNVNASKAEQSQYTALFFQDDWRITPKLTLNLGIRWEYNIPLTERYNRSISGFDFPGAQPYAAAAQAAYAAKPIAEIPASAFNTNGGLIFPGVNGASRSLWNGDKNNFMPRFGLAYQLTPKTILRGGYGLFFTASGSDYNDVTQTGFSLATTVIPSTDNGLHLLASLSNPFPGGILAPPGSSMGIATNVGRGISFYNQGLQDGYMQRWSFNIQRELPMRSVLEVGYTGNRGTKLVTSRNINATPNQYLSTTGSRDQSRIDYLNQLVANPFAGISQFTGTTFTGANIARSQLLRPYPSFSDITFNSNDGFSWYHSLTVNYEKRLSAGLLFQTNWTYSKFMEAISYLNGGDLRPYRSISDQDSTHRYTFNVLYELPIGHGKRFFGTMNRWADLAFGGWQIQGSYEGQSGNPLGFGNMIFNGDLANIPIDVADRRAERWFNTAAGFETRAAYQLASNVRTAQLRFSGVRGDGINNLDASLMKRFRITERLSGQFRLEGINAANHVQFADPNTNVTNSAFGSITSERGHGQRQINFFFKLIY
ncbi:MAG: TonB-dependent receptor [Acidobacteria bacterium]|nr:TonB-dependent receptor [Acidobacteriota bacterium]